MHAHACAWIGWMRPGGSPRLPSSAIALVLLLVSSEGRAGDGAPRTSPGQPADSLMTFAPSRDSLASFPEARVRAWQTGLMRADRLDHAGLSFTLAVALTIVTRSPAAAAGATLALGMGKELLDARHSGGADPVDLAADACGVLLALGCVRARAP
jgi:hypothetical protein